MRRSRSIAIAIAGVATVCLVLAGCSGDDAVSVQRPGTTAPPRPVGGSLTVLAEPGLAAAMSSNVPSFEGANPGATVAVESLETADIVARVQAGGGDVVALYDTAAMDELEGNGLVAAVLPLPRSDGARAGAVVASPNPAAATRFVELVSR